MLLFDFFCECCGDCDVDGYDDCVGECDVDSWG